MFQTWDNIEKNAPNTNQFQRQKHYALTELIVVCSAEKEVPDEMLTFAT